MPRASTAIHFHDDDVYDAGWATDFELTVPDDLPSGAYLMRLSAEGHADELPFYVRPPRGRPRADVLFIASTYTYQAYANHARGTTDAAYRERVAAWGAYPHNPDNHPDYGRSTYNRHRDGSGICYSSRLRPVLTFRPRYLTFLDARGSGLRHYSADTHLLDWLETHGIPYDVVTDEDVDAEGAALLTPYATVLTGSHPEYHTARTLDAHAGYLEGGGKLVYLGGNGFYWRIATSPAVPGVIEVRRAEGGIRAWDAQTGEYYHALDGAYGGLWRRNGRPPQRIVGVGFSAQGSSKVVLSPPAGADDPGRPGSSRASRRGDRRLRPLGRRGGRLRARPRGPRARHARGRHRGGQLRGARPELHRGARGAALAPRHGHRRKAGPAPAGRHDLCRAAGRGRGLRGGLHHLLRQPVAQPLRQQRLPHPAQCPGPLPRARREAVGCGWG